MRQYPSQSTQSAGTLSIFLLSKSNPWPSVHLATVANMEYDAFGHVRRHVRHGADNITHEARAPAASPRRQPITMLCEWKVINYKLITNELYFNIFHVTFN